MNKNINMNINMNTNMNNICNNCGKQGHILYNCKLPIISFGIIVFKYNSEGLQFLMIRRKDSFGYIDFIRGKYSPYNLTHLLSTIDEMSLEEKSRILCLPFETLWKEMWSEINNNNNLCKNEEKMLPYYLKHYENIADKQEEYQLLSQKLKSDLFC
jgi:hypothetical protein